LPARQLWTTGRNASAIPSVTGGLADLHSYPLPWAGDFPAHHGELRLADLPARCLLAGTGACRRVAGRQSPGIGDRIM
jgi:hypothetical protein